MKKFIKVYDNIIPLSLQDHLEEVILSNKLPWFFKKNISGVKNDSTFGFSHQLYTAQNPTTLDKKNLFNFLQIPYLLSNYLNLNITEIFQSRLFLLPPSPNPRTVYEGTHIDINISHYVCLYYVNNSDGDTVFFDDNKNEIKRVSPKKGRIAFFSGNIFHCTSIPTNNVRFIHNTNFLLGGFGKEKEN